MDWTIVTGGGLTGLVVFVAWMIRQVLGNWLADATITRILPVIVTVVAVTLTLLAGGAGLMSGGLIEGLTVAAAAMALYSGGKAVLGQS